LINVIDEDICNMKPFIVVLGNIRTNDYLIMNLLK